MNRQQRLFIKIWLTTRTSARLRTRGAGARDASYRSGVVELGALASLGRTVCRAFEAVGLAIVDCDDADGMVVLGGLSIFLAVAAAVTGATAWGLMRR